MALFHANHTLTQGSLHYRLATLGYRNRNTYGVETCICYTISVNSCRWYGVNRVMKCTNQCLNCESTL